MAEQIQTEYRGHVITFSEHDESWTAEVAEKKSYTRQLLADVKKKIDEFEKAESQYKNLPAIFVGDGYGQWGPAFGQAITITSVQTDGDVWTNRDGKREKIYKGSRDYLCAVTPDNEAKVLEYKELKRQREELDAKMGEVAASMERIFKD